MTHSENLTSIRHRISQLMRIVAPIFLFLLVSQKGLVSFFWPPSPPPSPSKGLFSNKKGGSDRLHHRSLSRSQSRSRSRSWLFQDKAAVVGVIVVEILGDPGT